MPSDADVGRDGEHQVMRFWLGVVQREHVLRGVALGIAQINHGSKAVGRMAPGDGFVYYSPKTAYPVGDPLREFTAIGRIAEGEMWQAEDGDFRPWRRKVDYDGAAVPAPITPLLDVLDLTRGNRNWGYQLRRGQLELTEHDFRVIAEHMGADSLLR
jgi:hypothetical protein